MPAGTPVKLKILRQDEVIETDASSWPSSGSRARSSPPTGPPPGAGSGSITRAPCPTTTFGDGMLGAMARGGVVVTEVEPDSPADRAGLKRGQVIRSVEGKSAQEPPRLRPGRRRARRPGHPRDRPGTGHDQVVSVHQSHRRIVPVRNRCLIQSSLQQRITDLNLPPPCRRVRLCAPLGRATAVKSASRRRVPHADPVDVPHTPSKSMPMTTDELREAYLDFFASKGCVRTAERRARAQRPDRAVHAGRDEPVQARVHGPGRPELHPRHDLPEVPPHRRHRERRQDRLPRDVLRDAGQLQLRRLLQARGDPLGLGVPDQGPEDRPPTG